MATETYTHYYFVTAYTPGVSITVGSLTGGGQSVIEQGTVDGSVSVPSADSEISYFGLDSKIVGLLPNGDPIIAFMNDESVGSLFIASNDLTLQGQTLAVNTSAPYLFCFAAGTMIATEAGEQAVEGLKIGDLVRTHDGRVVPVKWIGLQTVSTRFNPSERLRPVRIAAGALGEGLPHSDLIVTADHALLLDGVLCTAAALVNDETITRVPLAGMGERFTVYHVETEAHDMILANGAVAETFVDHAARRAFDNYGEYEALYGNETPVTEAELPRAVSARQLPDSLHARLATTRKLAS